MAERIKPPPARLGLCDEHRRDIEMIMIGIALAGNQQVREEIAAELASTDIATGGILSEESSRLITAIGEKDTPVLFNWLADRGVVLERGLSVRAAIAARLTRVADLTRVRTLCQRLARFELLDTASIVRIAAEIVQAGPQATATPVAVTDVEQVQ